MVADTLDEGSGDLNSDHFHERLDRRAIELSFSSTRDTFRGSLRMLKDNKDDLRPVADVADLAAFEQHDVERVRSQVISNLRRDTTNPSALAGRKFLEMAYGDHPYGRQANGTLESVPKIEIADLKDYVRRVLAKDTLKIAVVGDVDPATLGALLDKTFGGLPAKASLTPVPDVDAAKPPERAFIPLDVPQTGFGGPASCATIRISWPPMSSTTFSAAAGCRRGSITRSARSAGWPIRSINHSAGWTTRRWKIFVGNTGTRAPAKPSRPSTRKSAGWPTANPDRAGREPSPI